MLRPDRPPHRRRRPRRHVLHRPHRAPRRGPRAHPDRLARRAARPFYTATPGAPGTLARRRHLHLRHREVVRLDDEVFDLEGLDEAERSGIVGEAALLATLRRGRTGRMSDVVATIQEEQDQVIRSGLQGVLVVQGGPGTGKTVAALHRAAYLLYTHRDVLERRGVLIVGPNATFLRYIEQVLPGLGETDVALATVGELYPGLKATARETPAVAVLKGDLRMADLVQAAVHDRQRVPADGLHIDIDGLTLTVDAEECEQIRDRARALRLPTTSSGAASSTTCWRPRPQPSRAVRPHHGRALEEMANQAVSQTGFRNSSTRPKTNPPGRNGPPPGEGSPLAGPDRPQDPQRTLARTDPAAAPHRPLRLRRHAHPPRRPHQPPRLHAPAPPVQLPLDHFRRPPPGRGRRKPGQGRLRRQGPPNAQPTQPEPKRNATPAK